MSGSFRNAAAVFPAQAPPGATDAERQQANKAEILASLGRVRALSELLLVSETPSGNLTAELRDLAKAYLRLAELRAEPGVSAGELETARKDLEAANYTYVSAARAECFPDP